MQIELCCNFGISRIESQQSIFDDDETDQKPLREAAFGHNVSVKLTKRRAGSPSSAC